MTLDDGADSRLAPVIDLFGGRRGQHHEAAPSSDEQPTFGFPARGVDGLAKARAALEEITAASRARRGADVPATDSPTAAEAPAGAETTGATDEAGWWVDDAAESSADDAPSVVPHRDTASSQPSIPQSAGTEEQHATGRGRRARAEATAASRWGAVAAEQDDTKAAPRLSIEEASTRALARRGLSVTELQQKLIAIGYEQSAVDAEIERMIAARYLDDVRLAEEIVRVEFERKGKGRAIVTAELRRRGVAPEDYLPALDEIDTDLELERAADIAYRKMASSSDLDSRTAERRLSALLARRGFSGELARAAVARATERLANGD